RVAVEQERRDHADRVPWQLARVVRDQQAWAVGDVLHAEGLDAEVVPVDHLGQRRSDARILAVEAERVVTVFVLRRCHRLELLHQVVAQLSIRPRRSGFLHARNGAHTEDLLLPRSRVNREPERGTMPAMIATVSYEGVSIAKGAPARDEGPQ